MSYVGQGQTIPQNGAFTSVGPSQADTDELFNQPLSYPYMCDQDQEEMQFADKIKMM